MRLGLQKRGGLWQKIPELWQDYHIDTVDLNQQESVRDVANGIIGIYRGMQVLRSNVLYGPTPITSGPPAYRLVEDGKLDSIYDIYSHPDLLKQVIKDNTEAAKSDAINFELSEARNHFLKSVYYLNPVAIEAIQLRKQELVSQTGNSKLKYEEKSFMTLWTAVISNIVGCMVQKTAEEAPWWQSTGGIQEFGMATFIEAGLWRSRPDADMYFIDRDTERYVNLYERCQKVSETIKADIEAGHPSSSKLTTLARMFEVHRMLQEKDELVKNANPSIHAYDKTKIQTLINEMTPLLTKCQVESIEKTGNNIIKTEGLTNKYFGKNMQRVAGEKETSVVLGM